ncbi:ABC transporter substrate-binding protein [Chondrinema litorale]|uniref:ABC transporter substrate-binding protein n=1 Tax=Chondrinema litorale TaxID=2994555 RepID=UPI0025426B97|nr:ABC transporter substrate-binding protein [Chondrinema litorale]UZR97916.1 ABC transporter substrate-binding protein [Chondrinema litorale]
MTFKKSIYFLLTTFTLFACSSNNKKEEPETANTWEEVLQDAKGKTVTFMMWQGDPLINKYIQGYVVPEVKHQYDITLNVIGGQGNDIVNTLMTEIQAGNETSEVDMMWINGETFYQLRQIDALYGPFTEKLPNNQYIDWNNPFISIDFQQQVAGYECPWGNVQMAFIYNSDKVENPPLTMEALEEWVKANPGKFTIGNDFTGMTLLKSWLIHLAGGASSLDGKFDQQKYEQLSKKLWDYINRIKPYFWNEGKTFPASVAQMHQLFASGELWFTMSNNDSEVDNKIQQQVFAETSRAYVPETGSIQNSHYLGIVKHAGNKNAAMVVCNFLISPEAQAKKMQPQVWGDGTVLSIDKLPEEWQKKFNEIPGRENSPPRVDIQPLALKEPAPEYMMKLFEDFRKEVINQ